MNIDSALAFVGAKPPEFSEFEATEIALEQFGIKGTLTPLWGERDQNFLITTGDDKGYVLKISNSRESEASIDCQIKAMQHLKQQGTVSVPGVIRSKDGRFYIVVRDNHETKYLVYMLELLPGINLSDISYDRQLIYSAARQAGRAAFNLRGFFHAAAGRTMFWDVRTLADYTEYVPHIKDALLRAEIEEFIVVFDEKILPHLNGLRKQIIHHDTNPANVLVSRQPPHEITGLIDFGDMIHGSIVQDIAAAAELISAGDTMLDDICALVRGYDDAYPLEECEIDLVYDFIVARYVIGLLIGVTRNLYDVSSVNDIDYINLYATPLKSILNIGRDATRKAIRHSCGFPPYCPPGQINEEAYSKATETLIRRRHNALGTELALTYDKPLHIVKSEAVWLYDINGRAYLDCYNNVPCVGHCHPRVVKAISRQASALNTNTRYLFENVVEYAERLAATMPGNLGACLFVNSGSEANDLALRMAKICSGQDGAIIIDGAYHGITNEIYALSPAAEWGMQCGSGKDHISRFRKDIEMLENPDVIRGRFSDPGTVGERYAADTERVVATLEANGHPPGAFIFDSSFSTHGILDVPEGYLQKVVARVRGANGMIIADEVQYGFGRSGEHFWGFQNHDIIPDFVTLGKPIGNGLAIGAVVTSLETLEKFTRYNEFFSTFGGNPVACAASSAVMDIIEAENLMENSQTTGRYLKDGLTSVSSQSSVVGDIRGKGLFIGIDIVSDKKTMIADQKECKRIQNHLRENGCLVGTEGLNGNILKIRPPLVFKEEHADIIIKAFSQALSI